LFVSFPKLAHELHGTEAGVNRCIPDNLPALLLICLTS